MYDDMSTPPYSTVVHFISRQSLLIYTILHCVQPSSVGSSSLPSPMYFHFQRPPSYAVFLSSHHMCCCQYGISCPSGRNESGLLLSYACLLPQSSFNYPFTNLHCMLYHLDASIISTILDVPLLCEDWYDHTVPTFLRDFLMLENRL